nr:hypothetical protein [Tanacetum cinerariifolium]
NPQGSGRPGEPWQAPWGTDTIVDTILPDFKWILKDLVDGDPVSAVDGRLSNIIRHMESWLSQSIYIMLEEPTG